VRDSIAWICKRLELIPALEFSGGDRGWIGDNPFIYLDVQKATGSGWSPQLTIQQSVEATVDWLTANEWVFGEALSEKRTISA
jgi:UDP-glucose 4-epimerase